MTLLSHLVHRPRHRPAGLRGAAARGGEVGLVLLASGILGAAGGVGFLSTTHSGRYLGSRPGVA